MSGKCNGCEPIWLQRYNVAITKQRQQGQGPYPNDEGQHGQGPYPNDEGQQGQGPYANDDQQGQGPYANVNQEIPKHGPMSPLTNER